MRVVDVFVDVLDLGALGFEGVDPAATGRPAYHPAILLKIYIYGCLNRIQPSRRREREAERNVEPMWLTVVADRGYYKGLEILACEQAGIATFVPKPLTSGSKAEGRFGKQDFIYVAASDE